MAQTAGSTEAGPPPATARKQRAFRGRHASSTPPSVGSQSVTGQPQRGRDRSLLPNGRAVLGGFLIAASGVGLFAAYQQSNAAPQTRYVVTTRSLAPGEIVQRDDLGLAPAEVPPEMADEMTRDWAPLVGRVTRQRLVATSS